MKNETFRDFVAHERERLTARLGEINNQEQVLAEERDAIERELAGIAAYVAAKEGRLKPVEKKRRGGRALAGPRSRNTPSRPRAPRGERRTQVLNTIKEHEEGLSRGEIIELLGIKKGDKSGAVSVSNALSALKKAEYIESRDGKYVKT